MPSREVKIDRCSMVPLLRTLHKPICPLVQAAWEPKTWHPFNILTAGSVDAPESQNNPCSLLMHNIILVHILFCLGIPFCQNPGKLFVLTQSQSINYQAYFTITYLPCLTPDGIPQSQPLFLPYLISLSKFLPQSLIPPFRLYLDF